MVKNTVPIAQWIARWTSNPEVPGSSPGGDVVTVAWPSGLRRWIKVTVSSEAWVRIPLLSLFLLQLFYFIVTTFYLLIII